MSFKPYELRNYVRGAEAARRMRARMDRSGSTLAGQPLWTKKELEECRRLYPDYKLTKRKLRRRSLVAIQRKCNELGLVPSRRAWTGSDISKLRKIYATAANSELLAAFPGRSLRAIKHAANSRNIFRQKRPYKKTNYGPLDHLRARCFDKGYVMRDIDFYAHSKSYFQSVWPNAPKVKINARAILAAIHALGGNIEIKWD